MKNAPCISFIRIHQTINSMVLEVLKATKCWVSRLDIMFSTISFSKVMTERNDFDINIQNLLSTNVFKKELLTFITPDLLQNLLMISMILKNWKELKRLRFGRNYLGDRRFRYNFQGCVFPIFTVIRILTHQPYSSSTTQIIAVQEKPAFK